MMSGALDKENLSKLLVTSEATLRQVMFSIDQTGKGIVLIVDSERSLLGVLTDGDVRRFILAGINQGTPVSELLAYKASQSAGLPITAQVGTEDDKLVKIMRAEGVRQLPLLDEQEKVVDLVTIDQFVSKTALSLHAVIMAGGRGERLRPLTDDLPKPMLLVGGRPLMEWIIGQLREVGIKKINVTTHYKSEKITEYFGDGRAFGVEINYVREDRPLGTVGALGLMVQSDTPLLVINGDIFTTLDFRALLSFHKKHDADLTLAVRQYNFQVPYGVIECEGPHIRHVSEKPIFNYLVNAGVYLLEPSVRQYIPIGERFDMTDLIQCLIENGGTVVGFPVIESWSDVGQHADYEKAQRETRKGR